MRVRISLPEEFEWLQGFSPRLRARLIVKLLVEKFGGLPPDRAMAKAYQYVREEETSSDVGGSGGASAPMTPPHESPSRNDDSSFFL